MWVKEPRGSRSQEIPSRKCIPTKAERTVLEGEAVGSLVNTSIVAEHLSEPDQALSRVW